MWFESLVPCILIGIALHVYWGNSGMVPFGGSPFSWRWIMAEHDRAALNSLSIPITQ